MPPSLTHIALQVPDVAAMVDFYARYCGMEAVHRRAVGDEGQEVVWLAEPAKRDEMILVLIPGGVAAPSRPKDYSHLGFALESRDAVDRAAAQAKDEGRLIWPPREEPYPVGYYCGVLDPAGQKVEFSYGQPLGPGAPT